MPDDTRTLRDAYVRIDEARMGMKNLRAEAVHAVKQTAQSMAKGWSDQDNTFHLQLPPAAMDAPDRVRAMCGRIVEDLRAALDYGIVGVSRAANPGMAKNELRRIKFVIAHDRSGFDASAKHALACIDPVLEDFIERLQPYNGNQVLEFIAEESVISKHHNLLQLDSAGSMEVVLREETDRSGWESHGWWVFPAGKGHIYTARAPVIRLVIQERRDALEVLPICIDHVDLIIDTLERYLQDGALIWPFST